MSVDPSFFKSEKLLKFKAICYMWLEVILNDQICTRIALLYTCIK